MHIIPVPVPPPLLHSWPSLPGGGAFGGSNHTNHANGTFGDGDRGGPGGDLSSNWSSLIGIVTAIVGNVLIALALNVQRYAHTRLHKEQQRHRERARQALKDASNRRDGGAAPGNAGGGGYGSVGGQVDGHADYAAGEASESDPLTGRSVLRRGDAGWSASSESRKSMASPGADADNSSDSGSNLSATSTSYLHSPYWWLGQVLITVGECGNFLAYGFAPASIVSPLGVVALISNCVIAPILFKEPFRVRDFGGVIIAIAGAVTVVLSAKQEETKLNPHDVWDAITTTAFEIYAGVTFGLIALLMWASPRYGNRTILIDLGLVGLFGAYTVLATKGVSSMLSSTLLGAFLTPMTYVLLVILLGTAVMQVRYVNKALQRFDSTQVIPIQFVMFTLSVIIGSAVLYRDFERTTAEQAAKFVGGCLLTFFGVFIITSGRPQHDGGDDDDDEEEGIRTSAGSAINLAEQTQGGDDLATPATPSRLTLRSAGGSRRSSRASRVNFVGTLTNRSLSLVATETGVPSHRTPNAAPSGVATSVPRMAIQAPSSGPDGADYLTCKTDANEVVYFNEDDEDSADESGPSHPLLDNPWRSASFSAAGDTVPSSAATTLLRPSLGPSPYSADSVLQIVDNANTSATSGPPQADRPVTPSTLLRPPQTPSTNQYYYNQSPLFSPSPLLSSTVSTVVADTILQHLEGGSPQASRRPSTRRMRGSLRSSLFVPQDEVDLEDSAERGQLLAASASPYRSTQRSTEALASAVGASTPSLVDVPEESERPGLRSRAQSITTTLGGLLWPRRKSIAEDVEVDHDIHGVNGTHDSHDNHNNHNNHNNQDDHDGVSPASGRPDGSA
ncbi:hypothetical protein F503_02840 [Ophiostoma piceae UAMH 11346]|uniref:Duf803 domain membrane protein n=1 Tax=Ophiostoma piceae (strain UAMH 11346) TaxID=1262450 RepID=S3C2M1_OPHP1|nr:hypothetical protein F503_02840 [Ophiostoma piceae UAMH 11346]